MNRTRLQYLICPECQSGSFDVLAFKAEGDDLVDAQVTCTSCGNWYRIENGIFDLLPLCLRRIELYTPFAKKYSLPLPSAVPHNFDEAIRQQMAFFKDESQLYDQTSAESPFYLAFDELTLISWIKRCLKPGDLVLDIGCGTGRQYGQFKQFGLKSIGFDISEEMLSVARRKVLSLGIQDAIDHVVGEAGNLPVKDGCFDASIMYGVLHHLPNPRVTVSLAARKLRDGGFYFSLDPHNSPIRFLYDLLARVWKLYNEETGPEPLFSENELEAWLLDSGITPQISLNAYLPPHIFMIVPRSLHLPLVAYPDKILGNIPCIRKLAGVIMAQGIKSDYH